MCSGTDASLHQRGRETQCSACSADPVPTKMDGNAGLQEAGMSDRQTLQTYDMKPRCARAVSPTCPPDINCGPARTSHSPRLTCGEQQEGPRP